MSTNGGTFTRGQVRDLEGYDKFQSRYPILATALRSYGSNFTESNLQSVFQHFLRNAEGDRSALQKIDDELDLWQNAETVKSDYYELLGEDRVAPHLASFRLSLVAGRRVAADAAAATVVSAHDKVRPELFKAQDSVVPTGQNGNGSGNAGSNNGGQTADNGGQTADNGGSQSNDQPSSPPSNPSPTAPAANNGVPTWVWFVVGAAILLFLLVLIVALVMRGRSESSDVYIPAPVTPAPYGQVLYAPY